MLAPESTLITGIARVCISLGTLRGDIPVRTERIAHCRNRYLEELKGESYSDVDYVVVSDLDGMNRLLTRRGVMSSFERGDWDVCCANQRGPITIFWRCGIRPGRRAIAWISCAS